MIASLRRHSGLLTHAILLGLLVALAINMAGLTWAACFDDASCAAFRGQSRTQTGQPPVKFQPDLLEREIQRAFTIGNPPSVVRQQYQHAQLTHEPAPFEETTPEFSAEYPVCATDGVEAHCH